MRTSYMPSAEARAILERLGVAQQELARLLGINPRTVRRWLAPEVMVPPDAALLLELLDEFPDILPWLEGRRRRRQRRER